MASEIRVNKIANRAGLSTVEYTDTGIIVSGIITCTEISGINALNIAGVSTFASPLDINGDIDVDGHTNLDNVSIAGVTTFGGSVNYPVGAVANFFDDVNFRGPSGRDIVFDKSHAELHFSDDTTIIMGTNDDLFVTHDGTNPSILTKFGTLDIKTSQVAISTNMTVGGISTFNEIKLGDNKKILFGNDTDLTIYHNGTNAGLIQNTIGQLQIQTPQFGITAAGGGNYGLYMVENAQIQLYYNGSEKFKTTNTGAVVTGIMTATSFSGDGSSLSNLPAGAPVGGASTNTVFFENDTAVAVNYQISSGKNAMSAGPIAINAGIAVTVPSGSSWTIV